MADVRIEMHQEGGCDIFDGRRALFYDATDLDEALAMVPRLFRNKDLPSSVTVVEHDGYKHKVRL